jgi:AraC family transcriptional regulator, regulatory protein of adaptative response / DNA-3-methyladenine glycosylase II
LIARVEFGEPRSLFFITERIRAMFDLNADWAGIVRTLKSDAVLAPRIKANPGLRVPGCWDGFELTVRAILGQQVSVKGASTLAGRIVRLYGTPFAAAGLTHIFPQPAVLSEADFKGTGLTRSRAETIRALARAVRDGRISFEHVVDSADLLARLREIPGIGDWTAQYVAMRALGEPDAFPASDLGLLRATGLRNVRDLQRRSAAWRPWRAYVAMYLWSRAGGNEAYQEQQEGSNAPVSIRKPA